MPSYKSSSHARPPYSATDTVRRAARRARKLRGAVRPSLPEMGLYRTVAGLAEVTPFPEYVIRKWIRQGFIKLVWYKGAWYLSKKQFYSWYRMCLEIFPIFMESLTEDFGFPVIFEDGKYRRL